MKMMRNLAKIPYRTCRVTTTQHLTCGTLPHLSCEPYTLSAVEGVMYQEGLKSFRRDLESFRFDFAGLLLQRRLAATCALRARGGTAVVAVLEAEVKNSKGYSV
jgi:hypothetical protein